MKKNTLLFGILLMALSLAVKVNAVPAYPKAVTYPQPNGEKITVFMQGDEHIHWAVTTDGYTLLPNSEGYMTYAYSLPNGDLIPSSVIANDVKQRTATEEAYLSTVKKGMTFSKQQFQRARARRNLVGTATTNPGPQKSYIGTQKVIVLLVSYTDVQFSHTTQEFNDLYNKLNYTTGGAQGSVRDFYREASYGQMDLVADVYGPIQLSHNRAYYGGNSSSSGGSDQRPAEMVREAVLLADSLYNVDYSKYDVDHDGYVDVINVVFAGHGEETGATSNAIWSHQWAIQSTRLDGVICSSYSCSPECRNNSGTNISRIGVVCHELGHVFGAADYYDIDYSGFDGTGQWDIMASGSWNNNGITPAHHNPYVKIYDYGWVNPIELNSPCAVTMPASTTNKDSAYFIVKTATNREIFILENKQKLGFDSDIPGHGLVIFRKHANMSSYGPNDGHPQGFYPVNAASTYSIPTSSTSSYGTIDSQNLPFPGNKKKTSFTDATTPSMKSWNGTPTNKPITNITENTTKHTITFDFMGGPTGNPLNFQATLVNQSEIDLSWDLCDNNPVMLVVTTDNKFGTPANTTYNVGQSIYGGGTVLYVGNATSFQHLNLQAGTHYFYKLYSKISLGPIFKYSPGVLADAATGCATVYSAFPLTLDFESEITDACWTVTDGTKTSDGQITRWRCGDGSDNSQGFTPLSGSFYGYCFYKSSSGDETFLNSPELDFSSCLNPVLSYNYINKKWSSDQDILEVQYRVGTSTTWTTAKTHNTDVQSWTADSVALPTNCTQVRFRGNPRYGYGIYLDDIRIGAQTSADQGDCPGADSLKWTARNGQVTLHWQGDVTTTYLISCTDQNTNQTSTYTVNDTMFNIPNINASHVYSWYVITLCSDAWSDTVRGGDFTLLPIDVEVVNSDEFLSLYPNPTHETLRVSAKGLEEKSLCQVIDMEGRVLTTFELLPGDVYNVDVTSWSKGIYFLKSDSKRHSATQRFVVQ